MAWVRGCSRASWSPMDLVHFLFFVPAPPESGSGTAWPFDLGQSWLLRVGLAGSAVRIAGAVLVVAVAGFFLLAGLGHRQRDRSGWLVAGARHRWWACLSGDARALLRAAAPAGPRDRRRASLRSRVGGLGPRGLSPSARHARRGGAAARWPPLRVCFRQISPLEMLDAAAARIGSAKLGRHGVLSVAGARSAGPRPAHPAEPLPIADSISTRDT